MNKKNYTTPALSVEEYEMVIITAASGGEVTGLSSKGVFRDIAPQPGTGEDDSAARSRSRGIWDED